MIIYSKKVKKLVQIVSKILILALLIASFQGCATKQIAVTKDRQVDDYQIKTIAKYNFASNYIFSGIEKPILMGIGGIWDGNKIDKERTENLFRRISENTKTTDKVSLISYNDLLKLKKSISKNNKKNSYTKLYEELGIKIILYGEIIDKESNIINFQVYDNSNNKKMFDYNFKDSFNSTTYDDFAKFLIENQLAKYEEENVLVGKKSESYEETEEVSDTMGTLGTWLLIGAVPVAILVSYFGGAYD